MICNTEIDDLLPDKNINIPKSWSKYISNTYNISLMYPPLWAKINSQHYAGIDGYFRIKELKTDQTLEDICKIEAYHKLQPYGSNPEIVFETTAGADTCLIVPSKDQPKDMKSQAALIIRHPKGIEIDKDYTHIILYADMDHLNDIKNSLIIEI